MEVIMGMILLLQVVILIQIMRGRKQVLHFLQEQMKEEVVEERKKAGSEFEYLQNRETINIEESQENAMKLVDEVLSEVFS